MKKIVTLIICVALVASLAVPAFASTDYKIQGKWQFNETLEWIHEDSPLYTVGCSFIIEGMPYVFSDPRFGRIDDYWVLTAVSVDTGERVELYHSLNEWATSYRTVIFQEPIIGYEHFYNWIHRNATQIYCDGSTCPATDVGADGICDVCGSTISVPETPDTDKSPTVTYETYNGVSLPTISTVWNDTGSYKACIIFKDKVSDTYHLIYGSYYDKDYVFYNLYLEGSPQSYCSIHNWTWYDLIDGTWTYQTANTNDVICRVESYDLIWANQTIYTDSTRETPFFQLPPTVEAPTLAGVITEETLAGVLMEVVAILPAGLVCLIGYLALRKALAVLRMVLSQA